MLKEIARLTPLPNEPRRRWFTDRSLDLFVWYDGDGQISGFQLCYGKPHNEHSVTWHTRHGFSHNRVDDGEDDPRWNRTPILLPDGMFPAASVLDRFERSSQHLEPDLVAFVVRRIQEYSTASGAA